jgi:hypothetical protein
MSALFFYNVLFHCVGESVDFVKGLPLEENSWLLTLGNQDQMIVSQMKKSQGAFGAHQGYCFAIDPFEL